MALKGMAAKYLRRIKLLYTFNKEYVKRCSRSQAVCLSGYTESAESIAADDKFTSRLFMSGRQMSQVTAVFRPELNINYIIDNCNEISDDLKRRNTTINLPMLVENLKMKRSLEEQANIINEERTNIKADSERLTDSSSDLMRKQLLTRAAELKTKLIGVKEALWNCEESTYPQLSRLPNRIHADTPSENEIIAEHGIKDKFSFHVKSHVEVGKLSKNLKFSDVSPTAYYLCNLASALELAVCNYFAEKMTMAGFVDVVNPDFCKSIILEGCGKSQKEMLQYITLKGQLDRQSLHLTGSASLEGYAALLSKNFVSNASLPLQYFSIGRCYTSGKMKQNLFSVSQAVKVTAFIASAESESMKHFSSLVDIIHASYRAVNLPFRSVKIAAPLLKSAESLRVGFDLWSPYEKDFVNVAHVSLCDDYISRRLMMKHGTGGEAEGFLHIVEATVTSVPVLIGCIMENMQTPEGNFSVPDAIKPYVNDILKT